MPTSNWANPALALDNPQPRTPMWTRPTWLKRHHVTAKKHLAAANQLPQRSLTPKVTQGHQERSLWLVCKRLAQAVDLTGLGTPTPLGMIQRWHTCCHLSLCLDEQLLKHRLQLIQCRVREQLRFRVVWAELIRRVQAAVISMITQCMKEMLVQHCHRVGRPRAKVNDRVCQGTSVSSIYLSFSTL